jgi:hypothetical protein
MSDSALLERRYRRLLACYPKAYRREREMEMLGVLMDTAREGQRRPTLAESADLLRGAVWAALRPDVPRSARPLLAAVLVMCFGAVVEAAGLTTYLLTAGQVKSVMLARDPAQWQAVSLHLISVEVVAPAAIGMWLLLAWAIGKRQSWARGVFALFFCLTTMSLVFVAAEGGATYATADLVATSSLWLVEFATAVLLIISGTRGPYYHRQPEVS